MRKQRQREISALCERQPLQDRGKIQAHEGRLLPFRHRHRIEGQIGINRVRHRTGDRVDRRELHPLPDREGTGVFVLRFKIGLRPGLAPGEGLGGFVRLSITDAEDAPARAVNAGVIVTLAGVAPVEDEAAPVRTRADLDAAKPRIVAQEDIGLVTSDIAAAVPFEPLDVGASSVHVQGEKFVPVGLGPLLRLIDHHADVGVASTEMIGLAVARVAPLAGAVVVVVVGDGVELLVDQRIRGVRIHEMRSVDEMPEMAGDRIDEKHLSIRVPIVSPGICRAVGEDLDEAFVRVIAPDPALHRDALFGGSAWHSEITRTGMTAPPVEPAIRRETETVGEVVIVRLGHGESVEHHLGRAVGNIVTVGIGDEQQLRRTHQPDPAAPHLDARQHLDVVGENLARLRDSVPVGVLENDDAILQREIEALLPLGVGVVLCDPHPTFRVPRKAHGILHVRLCGEESR